MIDFNKRSGQMACQLGFLINFLKESLISLRNHWFHTEIWSDGQPAWISHHFRQGILDFLEESLILIPVGDLVRWPASYITSVLNNPLGGDTGLPKMPFLNNPLGGDRALLKTSFLKNPLGGDGGLPKTSIVPQIKPMSPPARSENP